MAKGAVNPSAGRLCAQDAPKPRETPMPKPRAAHRQKPEIGQTKTARIAYERMLRHVLEIDYEGLVPYYDLCEIIPKAWDTLEQDIDVTEKKVKVTLLLDDSVAKFFRAQGQGYQARINRVLGTFAQMKIAEIRLAEKRLARIREEEAERVRREREGR